MIRIEDIPLFGGENKYTGALVYGGAPVPPDVDFVISDREVGEGCLCLSGAVATLNCPAPTAERPARRRLALLVGGEQAEYTDEDLWLSAVRSAELSVLLTPMADGQTGEDYHRLHGFDLFEVYSGACEQGGGRGDARFGLDSALRTAHPCHLIASGERVRLTLFAPRLDKASLLYALKAGRFAVSAGVELLELKREGDELCIRTTPCRHIRLVAMDCRGNACRHPDRRTPITQARLRIPPTAKYVRVECEGERGAFALSQPMFVHWPYTDTEARPARRADPAQERVPLQRGAQTAAAPFAADRAPLSHGKRYKGNLHAHSTRSDGKFTPEELIERYRAQGYDFLALTDHELYTRAGVYCREDFLVLSGVECSDYSGTYDYNTTPATRRYNYHFNAIWTDPSRPETEDGFDCREMFTEDELCSTSVRWRMQQRIDHFADRGCSIFLNHPRWSCNYEQDLYGFARVSGLEVYNHGAFASANDLSEDYLYYCLQGGTPMFCTATDDVHGEHELFGGYIVVSAPALTLEAVGEAIRKGRFYASTGAVIDDWRVDADGRVQLRCEPAWQISILRVGGEGCTLRGEGLREATLQAAPGDVVLARVCSDAGTAWTNPIRL